MADKPHDSGTDGDNVATEDGALEVIENTLKEMAPEGHDYDEVDDLEVSDDEADAGDDGDGDRGDGADAEPGAEEDVSGGLDADGAEKPAEDDEETAGKQEDKPDGDEQQDPLAGITNEKTKARVQGLLDDKKALTDQVETLKSGTEVLNTYISQSRSTPEQFSGALALIEAFNTGNFTKVREAMPMLEHMMQAVYVGTGHPNAQIGALPERLQQKVDNLDIDQDTANELARREMMDRQHHEYQEGQQQQQQQYQDQTQAYTNGAKQAAASITQWEKQMELSDPDFTVKRAELLDDAQEIMSELPPERWLSEVQKRHQVITRTMAGMANRQAETKARQHGMRPGQRPGQIQEAEPDSFEANFNQTLQNLRS